MKGILADINVQGHLRILLMIWQSEYWRDIWQSMALQLRTFDELGLQPSASDRLVWEECQKREIILLTANRNDDGPDSLTATIRERSNAFSLPVFTIADAQRLQHDRPYARLTAEKVLQNLLEIDLFRGAGRVFVP